MMMFVLFLYVLSNPVSTKNDYGFAFKMIHGYEFHSHRDNPRSLVSLEYHEDNSPGSVCRGLSVQIDEDSLAFLFGRYTLHVSETIELQLYRNDVWFYDMPSNRFKFVRGWADIYCTYADDDKPYISNSLPFTNDDYFTGNYIAGYGNYDAYSIPTGRMGTSGLYLSQTNEIILFFGYGPRFADEFEFCRYTATYNANNEVWLFDTLTKQFMWVTGNYNSYRGNYTGEGSLDFPGARYGHSVVEHEENKFLIFFGRGHNNGISSPDDLFFLNDVWAYDLITNSYTLKKTDLENNYVGDCTGYLSGCRPWPEQQGQEFFNNLNVPQGRHSSIVVQVEPDMIMVIGGIGRGESYSDVWKYNTTWNRFSLFYIMNLKACGGLNQVSQQTDFFGNLWNSTDEFQSMYKVAPGDRGEAAYFFNPISRRLLIFGGFGYGIFGSMGYLNSLYEFSVDDFKFRHVGGEPSNIPALSYAVYGDENVYSSLNIPGGRASPSFVSVWNEKENSYVHYIYGGYGGDGMKNNIIMPYGHHSDMWVFTKGHKCDGKLYCDPTVCCGNGECLESGACRCNEMYHGDDCSSTTCSGIPSESKEDICSSRGDCVSFDTCECYDPSRYFGKWCEITWCFKYMSNESRVCSGNGKCVAHSVCRCNKYYDGLYCENSNDFMLNIGANVSGIIFGTIFGMLILFCIFIAVVLVACLILSQSAALKKFRGIWDVDIILQEQKMIKEGVMPNLQVSLKSYRIDSKDIAIITELDGGGGSARVFKAEWKSQIVCYKRFGRAMVDDEKEKNYQEFEREVNLFMNLKHPNILSVYGVVIELSVLGYVMEYAQFGDMKHFITEYRNENKRSYPEKERLFLEIASALAFMHERECIHRDIKPKNIFISDFYKAKIADLGLSRSIDALSCTKTFAVGTATFMAPELVLGDSTYDGKVDVWSYCVLLWVIINEDWHPYGTDIRNGLEKKIARDATFRPKMNEVMFRRYPWAFDVIKKGLSANPEDRYSFKKICKIISTADRLTVQADQEVFLE